jgi:hypothetical protein
VNLDPNTRTITLQSRKWNVDLVLNATGKRAPFTSTVIQGSRNTISAPSPQFIDRWRYDFTNWSDGGAQTHNVVVNSNSTYTATYRRSR